VGVGVGVGVWVCVYVPTLYIYGCVRVDRPAPAYDYLACGLKYVCMCMFVYMFVCVFVCAFVFVFLCVYVRTYMHTDAFVWAGLRLLTII